MKHHLFILLLLASCGVESITHSDEPPPTCVDVANKVHANCVDLSDQPCDGSVYEAAYHACVEQTRTGKAVCVPNWNGRCAGEWVPADQVTQAPQLATEDEGS